MKRRSLSSSIVRIRLILFVLSISAITSAATETIVHSFIPWANGGGPSQLIADAQGNLYGTAGGGGTYGLGAVIKLSPDSSGHWQESVLYSFGTSVNDGYSPTAGVTLDAAGNLYGTTFYGGGAVNVSGNGIVYMLSPSGDGAWKETILHRFTGRPDGANPASRVTLDAAGNIYGTTSDGGTHSCQRAGVPGCGTVYELSPASDGTWTESVIHSFQENTGGLYPTTGLVIDAAGNLYGTTSGAGITYGSAFELSPSSSGWTFTLLHAFDARVGFDGNEPNDLMLDVSGNLFGTTYGGGVWGGGIFFELKNSGGVWKETILYSFNLLGSGAYPRAGIVMDSAGNFYGTTTMSGSVHNPNGNGTVYELSPNGSGGWTQTTLYTAPGTSNNVYPSGGVIFGPEGSLYGATINGGTSQLGTIFAVASSSGNRWAGSELYEFAPTDGAGGAGLLPYGADSFYGLTFGGGLGPGTAYKLSRASDGSWRENVIYTFSGLGSDGNTPTGSLILDASGNLYGTTLYGGLAMAGTAFRLSPSSNGTWIRTTLHDFGTFKGDGSWPLGSLVADRGGNLYGMTIIGGTNGDGTVYRLRHSPNGTWIESIIYNFTSTLDTYYPGSGLIIDSLGNLYGAAGNVVFELSQASSGKWTETNLYTFSSQADGNVTVGSLTFDAAGNLYGATQFGGAYGNGTIYELSPTAGGNWTETILYSFGAYSGDGEAPAAGVVFDAAGNLYGTTECGGLNPSYLCSASVNSNGTVFKLSPTSTGQWNETILYTFLGPPSDGSNPTVGVILDSSGNLFGTTSSGGLGRCGNVFEITP